MTTPSPPSPATIDTVYIERFAIIHLSLQEQSTGSAPDEGASIEELAESILFYHHHHHEQHRPQQQSGTKEVTHELEDEESSSEMSSCQAATTMAEGHSSKVSFGPARRRRTKPDEILTYVMLSRAMDATQR